MKLTIAQAVDICNTIGVTNQAKLGESGDKVMKIFIRLMPYVREYNDALFAMQKDAQGKTQEEVKDLVSVKAFEQVVTKEVEIDLPLLTEADLEQIGKNTEGFKVANFYHLAPIMEK